MIIEAGVDRGVTTLLYPVV